MTPPAAAFTALTPPRWLQHDMAVQAPAYPQVKALFLFADDLPHHERIRGRDTPGLIARERTYAYIATIRATWSESPQALELGDVGGLLKPLGSLTTNGKGFSSYERTNPLTGFIEESCTPTTLPRHAVILLPPRGWTARHFTAAVSGIPVSLCADLPEVNPHRVVAAHELSHLEQYSRLSIKHPITLKERLADAGAHAFCTGIGDAPSARYLYDWRLLSNLGNGMQADSVTYWNGLFQHGLSDARDEEYAAQLEVKLLACNMGERFPRQKDELVRTAFNRETASVLEARFNSLPPAQQLRQLVQGHQRRAYRFEASYLLGERTLAAAHRLTPGVFAPAPLVLA